MRRVRLGQSVRQLSQKNVDVNGVAREYLIYLPKDYDGVTELPLLFVYHGGAMSMWLMLGMTDMRPMADEENFLLVYPQGLPDSAGDRIWNSVGPYSNGVDDIGYTAAMIDQIDQTYALDERRVYACGYSNGGNIVWELACFLSDRVAAVGAVAGSMWTWTEQLCTPTREVAVLSIHGTLDFYNPYQSGSPWSMGLIEASEYWAQNNAATMSPVVVNLPDLVPNDGSTVTRFSWPDGEDCVAVEQYRVNRGGHDWPGKFGNMDIDANEVIWDFVSRYSLDGLIDCCTVRPIGSGAGGANIASLDSPSTPTLGSTMQLDFSGFAGSGNGFAIVSLRNANAALLGGTIYPDLNDLVATLPVTTGSNGAGSLSVPLGNQTALVGRTTYVQVGLPDPAQAAGWAFTNGLAVTPGNCN